MFIDPYTLTVVKENIADKKILQRTCSRSMPVATCIVLCRLVVKSALPVMPHKTILWSNVSRVFSPRVIVWCAVYMHFAACSLTTNLQSTKPRRCKVLLCGMINNEGQTPCLNTSLKETSTTLTRFHPTVVNTSRG